MVAQKQKRIHLTDEQGEATGRWYDPAKADSWEEATRWDGNNHVSLATGSQWDHELLIRTAGGTWVLHRWSQWQGSRPSYRAITPKEAAAWFIRNEHTEVPEELTQYVEEAEV